MEKDSVLKIIEQSNERCKAHPVGLILKNTVLSVLDKQLYKIANPCLQKLREEVDLKNSFFIVTGLKHENILQLGNSSLFPKRFASAISTGISFKEEDAGCNAIALCIQENRSITTHANEHTLLLFKKLSCSASPIHDEKNAIIGSVSIWQAADKNTDHLNMTSQMLASLIESNFVAYQTQMQFFNSQQYAFSMMNHLSHGVISVNQNDQIYWVNNFACDSLNIRRKPLLGSDIKHIFPQWEAIKPALIKGQSYEDEENSFQTKGSSEKHLINAYPIQTEGEGIIGFLISFRPFKRFIKIINKLISSPVHYHFDDIKSQNLKMLKLIDYAKSIADTPSSILITGESGTGKEVFAQAIHNASSRSGQAFVAVNCGAISESLIESELFGYEEGAFTGAKKGGRPGKFELANGGTLFLDEIGDMPYEMQVKLLRTIQENEVLRIGGEKPIPIDVRIITATNQQLEKEIEDHKFRLDLFYRINVISIHIPALRDRMEDIQPLIQHFIEAKAEKLNRKPPLLSNYFYELVHNYDWPGNIRELENFIEKTVALDGKIDFKPNFISKKELSTNALGFPEQSGLSPDTSPVFVPKLLTEIEKEAIINTLKAFDGNISKTAKCLNIGRNTLYKKIKTYHIEF